MANPFNTVDRGVLFEELQASPFSELLPFVRELYGAASQLLYERVDGTATAFSSATDTRQRAAIAGPFFAAAL